MSSADPYPISIPGVAWGVAEIATWRASRRRQRSYATDVLDRLEGLRESYEVVPYGRLDDASDHYPLFALRSRSWTPDLPAALITGGVHGYETSGVAGALRFAQAHAAAFSGRVNLLIAPCVSPWGYEHIQRWNPQALDPNRTFRAGSRVPECAALLDLVAPLRGQFLVHVDLHETTDSDETEFRPALAARDGTAFVPGAIPDGFYLVADSADPQLEFQQAILEAVAAVTHIAPSDDRGEIIGSPALAPGVIAYAFAELGLCAGITGARFTTTTEVYPDSPRATPEQCIQAQVAAVGAALEFALR